MAILHIPAACLLLVNLVQLAHSLNPNSTDDILKTSKRLASDLIKFYDGNQPGKIPGLLPKVNAPREERLHQWWESAAFMSTYLDYWQLTGDETYNEIISQGLVHQAGENADFMPANQTRRNMTNIDQSVWALSAMTAAEHGFPSDTDQPQWLDMATAVWEMQRRRWDIEVDDEVCNGGLRSALEPNNRTWNSKTSYANGNFFALSARLARFTGNETYAEWATKAWNWLVGTETIDLEDWKVFTGALAGTNCSRESVDDGVVSVSQAVVTMGAAFMYNHTGGAPIWKMRVQGLTDLFFLMFFTRGGYFREYVCRDSCPSFAITYEALAHRWISVTAQVAPPFTAEKILAQLRRSAAKDHGTPGANENESFAAMEKAMARLAVVSNLLISDSEGPVTWNTTGRDESDAEDAEEDAGNVDGEDDADDADESIAARLAGLNTLAPIALLVWAFMCLV